MEHTLEYILPSQKKGTFSATLDAFDSLRNSLVGKVIYYGLSAAAGLVLAGVLLYAASIARRGLVAFQVAGIK